MSIDPEVVNRVIDAARYLQEWSEGVFNSTGPVWAVINSTGPVWAVIGIQALYDKAARILSRDETREEMRIAERERETVRKKIRAYGSEIEAILWRGLDTVHDAVLKSGSKTITIHHGNDLIQKSISDFRRDYHHAFGKCTPVFVEDTYEEIMDELESKHTHKEREESLDEIARCARLKYLDGTHKRSGYNSAIEEMEDTVLPYSVIRDMVEKIWFFSAKEREKRLSKEKDIADKYAISILSFVKVAKLLFRRGKR